MEMGLNSCWAAVSKWEQSKLSAQMEEKYWERDTDLQLYQRGKEGHCNERCG